jgi:hypothetical protein
LWLLHRHWLLHELRHLRHRLLHRHLLHRHWRLWPLAQSLIDLVSGPLEAKVKAEI